MVAPTVEDSTASADPSKMNIVRETKQRLHHELTAHLRMRLHTCACIYELTAHLRTIS